MIVMPNRIMTATEVMERWGEHGKTSSPLFVEAILGPLVDKCLRICLRQDGISYRKFMFDRVKLNIE